MGLARRCLSEFVGTFQLVPLAGGLLRGWVYRALFEAD